MVNVNTDMRQSTIRELRAFLKDFIRQEIGTGSGKTRIVMIVFHSQARVEFQFDLESVNDLNRINDLIDRISAQGSGTRIAEGLRLASETVDRLRRDTIIDTSAVYLLVGRPATDQISVIQVQGTILKQRFISVFPIGFTNLARRQDLEAAASFPRYIITGSSPSTLNVSRIIFLSRILVRIVGEFYGK